MTHTLRKLKFRKQTVVCPLFCLKKACNFWGWTVWIHRCTFDWPGRYFAGVLWIYRTKVCSYSQVYKIYHMTLSVTDCIFSSRSRCGGNALCKGRTFSCLPCTRRLAQSTVGGQGFLGCSLAFAWGCLLACLVLASWFSFGLRVDFLWFITAIPPRCHSTIPIFVAGCLPTLNEPFPPYLSDWGKGIDFCHI